MTISRGACTPAGWDTKHAGRPSDVTLKNYVEKFEASCRPGGCNAHLGPTVVWSAKVIRQSTDEVVATYKQTAAFVVA